MQHIQSVASLEIPHLKKLHAHYNIHKNLRLKVILSHVDSVQNTLILQSHLKLGHILLRFPIQNYVDISCFPSVLYVSFIATSPILSTL